MSDLALMQLPVSLSLYLLCYVTGVHAQTRANVREEFGNWTTQPLRTFRHLHISMCFTSDPIHTSMIHIYF